MNDFEKDDAFVELLMLMNQSLTMKDPSPQIQYLNEQSEAMFNQTTRLIEKGQNLGQFKQENASEMAFYYFASLQGSAMVKLTMRKRYITPSLKIVTEFLIKDYHV
ncbi:hypothetical protein [Cytobacillus horneckiae]|uniref:hypothetical protein n=1 Tax=Cytobacillus horneckiae TaxID=549687 RepID=UPI003D1C16F2